MKETVYSRKKSVAQDTQENIISGDECATIASYVDIVNKVLAIIIPVIGVQHCAKTLRDLQKEYPLLKNARVSAKGRFDLADCNAAVRDIDEYTLSVVIIGAFNNLIASLIETYSTLSSPQLGITAIITAATDAAKDKLTIIEKSRDELESRVIERTRDLEKSNEKLRIAMARAAVYQGKIKENETRLKIILDSILTGVVIIAADTHEIVDVNPYAAKVIGLPKKKIIGKVCHKFICPADIGKCPLSDFKQKIDKSEKVLINRLGQRIPVLKTAVSARIGQKDYIVDSFVDITEQKNAEKGIEQASMVLEESLEQSKQYQKMIEESELKYKLIFESSSDAIMTLSTQKRFISGNLSTVRLFGCKDEKEFVSLSPSDVSPEYQPDGQKSMDKAMEMMNIAMDKGSHFFEWTHKRVRGTNFFATVLLSRMGIKGEKVLQATVRDVTEQKMAQQKIKEATDMKSNFTSMVSHELRTPLASIKEGIDIVFDGSTGEVNADQHEFLGIAKRNVDRLARLINDVLDFQKLEAGKMTFNIEENDINGNYSGTLYSIGIKGLSAMASERTPMGLTEFFFAVDM